MIYFEVFVRGSTSIIRNSLDHVEPICDQWLRMIEDQRLTTSHDVDFLCLLFFTLSYHCLIFKKICFHLHWQFKMKYVENENIKSTQSIDPIYDQWMRMIEDQRLTTSHDVMSCRLFVHLLFFTLSYHCLMFKKIYSHLHWQYKMK